VRQIKPENRSHIPHFPGSGHLLFLSKIKLGFPETSSQLTPSSSGESGTNRRRRTPWCRDRKNEPCVWQAAWTEIIQDKATPQAAAEKAFKRVEERWRRIIRDR
jgi:hypothetical protein